MYDVPVMILYYFYKVRWKGENGGLSARGEIKGRTAY
jgi:hypothetical protein